MATVLMIMDGEWWETMEHQHPTSIIINNIE
jgi:hypothetical protein